MPPVHLFIFTISLTLGLSWGWLQIRGLQVFNTGTNQLEGDLGYTRNFSEMGDPLHDHLYWANDGKGHDSIQVKMRTLTDTDISTNFCGHFERLPFQKGPWRRLEAAPGQFVCPHYSIDRLYGEGRGGGTVHWYGTSSQRYPDDRSVGDVINFRGETDGQALGIHEYPSMALDGCPNIFQIPLDTQPSHLYTVYWMWNTTQAVGNGFLLYTACLDIQVVPEPSPVALSSPRMASQRASTLQQLSSTGIPSCRAPSWSLPHACQTLTSSLSAQHPLYATGDENATDCPECQIRSSVWKPSGQAWTPSPYVGFQSSKLPTVPTKPIPSSVSKAVPVSSFTTASSILRGSVSGTSSPRVTSMAPSTIRPTSEGSFTQMVRLDLGEVTEFSPQSLDVPVGDTVWFYSLNGSFLLYNTTLEEPCVRVTRFGDDAHRHVLYKVNTTEPMWFLGWKPEDDLIHCYPSAHFALNPGSQWTHFVDGIQAAWNVTITTTTVVAKQT